MICSARGRSTPSATIVATADFSVFVFRAFSYSLRKLAQNGHNCGSVATKTPRFIHLQFTGNGAKSPHPTRREMRCAR
ncbi:hypothetical protein AGR13a_Lc140036 [Agrobacterium genomosp. 13 str. CFBP 6927]|uniref:Secreted protein n=1 Tax=Agrobacterium genomosp. 13 str. CFBP 6927 TaxID=1183428 RepID=A0ABP2BMI0_9HYPH|nr:hypothetical protein AGR13a_Lc140036 [Agrobacterium genomosp. 13 str. CFBP 6927]